MGIQHNESVPPSFGNALVENYLGDPDVVSRLVGEFLAEAESLLQNSSGEKEFANKSRALVRHYADIFSGRDASYKTISGYNAVTLKSKLAADLGSFWRSNRAKWDDDSVCVMFEWLLLMLADSLKRADGDQMLLGVMLKPVTQYAVKVFLGIEVRA